MATFTPEAIAVFDRSGGSLGFLTGWNIEQPRSFRLNEIEDFAFSLPLKDLVKNIDIVDAAAVDLLLRDNLVFLQNQMTSMRGWAGAITNISYGDDRVVVNCTGGLGLFYKLETDLIEQTEGEVWTIANRLVLAAQSKQAAHGDLVIGFLHDVEATPRLNLGNFAYEGDILAGLQQLASANLCEMFVHSQILSSGQLAMTLRWGGRYAVDNTDIVISDGVNGNIAPGNSVTFTTDSLVNRARLRGAPTNLSKYVDYNSIGAIIGDIVPEVEEVLDDEVETWHRRREELSLSVNFGYSEAIQKNLALQIQERYLGYYKAWLYAYHGRLGRPFLDGFDWAGPDGDNDKKLTAHYFRSWLRLGVIGHRTVITGSTDDDDTTPIEATIDDWQFLATISPVGTCVGVATDWSDQDQKFIANQDDGIIYILQSDLVTVTTWLGVLGAGETLRSIATDPLSPTLLWVLVTNGTSATVRTYNTADQTVVNTWTQTISGANDISVEVAKGVIWLVASSSGNVQARDINSGVTLTTGDAVNFASGFGSPAGLSVSGDLAYVVDASGNVRFLFTSDGSLAGTKSAGVGTSGLFVDEPAGRIWLIRSSDGNINTYRAHVAVASINAPGSADGAPGFEAISSGQFVSVVMTSDTAASPHPKDKLAIVYSPGKYITRLVETAPGELDVLQRTWVTGEQKFAIVKNSTVNIAASDQVVQGEESRVDDWDPKRDGYAAFGDFALSTRRGAYYRVHGWYFKDWDVPDTAFTPDPPDWTEGRQFLRDYLVRANKERGVQALRVNNRGNLFRKLVLGGLYTVQIALQGPRPAGLSGVLRVLAYTPDESQGICEIIGEWV